MRRSLFSLLTMLLLMLVAPAAAWAETAILSFKLGANGADATSANSITGAKGSKAEGWTIAITGNSAKDWTAGNGTMTYNKTAYKTLKNSNGAQNTVTLPEGYVATSITFWVTTNTNADNAFGRLSEIAGESCNEAVTNIANYAQPTVITKPLDKLKSFTFTFSGKQVCFIAVVDYQAEGSSDAGNQTAKPGFSAILNDASGTLLQSSELVQGTAVEFGVADVNGQTVRVAANADNAMAVISGKYHNDHGMTGLKVVAKVNGSAKISIGECTYSKSNIQITDAAGNVVADQTPEFDCWKNDHSKEAVIYYDGPATTLTITGMTYCPYIAIQEIDAVPQVCAVRFFNGSQLVTTLSVFKGSSLGALPAAPDVASGKLFRGWYTATDGSGVKALPTLSVEGSMDFYAYAMDQPVLTLGYYVVPRRSTNRQNGEELLNILEVAQSGDKVFLPNATYDLGTACLTAVPAGVSLIGQSQEGVIIRNTPLTEGIGITATLMPQGNVYMQDLSIQCSSELCATPEASRCVTIQDKATRNTYYHVTLLSGQDTYYSAGKESQQSFFDQCRITGTVDYICGGGDVVFRNTTFYNNARSNGDVIFAPATKATTKWGYVALDCTVDGDASTQNGKFNIGRDWQGSPAATLINTTFQIMPTAAAYSKMSKDPLVLRFHEYNSHKADGTAITGHNLNAMEGGRNYNSSLYLSAADAARYTLANIFAAGQYDGVDAWDPASLTAQAVANLSSIEASAIYLVEGEGSQPVIMRGSDFVASAHNGATLRKANGRGGFGDPVVVANGNNLTINLSSYTWANLCAGKGVAADWYGSTQAMQVADIVLAVQKTNGGWMKNDQLHKLSQSEYNTLVNARSAHSCLDNTATTQEMRFLARVYQATGVTRYRDAIVKALDMIIAAEFPKGGWGQYWPLTDDKWSYQNYITFNDDLVVNVLKLMRDMYDGNGEFAGVCDEATAQKCRACFDRGVQLIIDCQYDDNGTKAAWCAQHDPSDLLPVEGRPHELPSISGYESAAILSFLMTIQNPSVDIKRCVVSAVEWLQSHKYMENRYIEDFTNASGEKDRRVSVKQGSNLWGRFIQLGGASGKAVYDKFIKKLKDRNKKRKCTIHGTHEYYEYEIAQNSYDAAKAYQPIYSIYDQENHPQLFYRFLYSYEDAAPIVDSKGCTLATSLNAQRRTSYQYLGSWCDRVINTEFPAWKVRENVQGDMPAAATLATLSAANCSSSSDDIAYQFSNGFSMTNGSSKKYAAGNEQTIKYSAGVTYTIHIPEGKQVTRVSFYGYDNYADADTYLSSLNGQTFASTAYVFPARVEGNAVFVTRDVSLQDNPAIGTLPFRVDGKQCCLIITLTCEDITYDTNRDKAVNVADVITLLHDDVSPTDSRVKAVSEKILKSEN